MLKPLDDGEFDLEAIKIHSTEVVEKPVVGSPYTKPVEIIVDAQAWQQMNEYARQDLRYEHGGIMLGGIYEHDDGVVVRITTSVPAREAVNDIASIRITYEAWRQMEQEHQKHAPTEKLVGWYHTHPGFTAFFSDTDLFTHENFFTQPWHVALVIDPVNGEHSFYRWENGHVVHGPEFLLQVVQWPGPEAPLHATLARAVRQSAHQIRQEGKKENYSLEAALRDLEQRLPRVSTGSLLHDLLPLIIATAEFEPQAIAQARWLVQHASSSDKSITLADLRVCCRNSDPGGRINIAHGWLAQQAGGNRLHVHGLEASLSLCQNIELPVGTRDLTLDQFGNLLVLTRDNEKPLHLLIPPLSVLSSLRQEQARTSLTLSPLPIQWGDNIPAQKIGRILMGRRHLYLLTKTEIFVLFTSDDYIPAHFACVGVHSANACEWASFELTDWATDPAGNLYLLADKEVCRFDPLREDWLKFPVDDELVKPRSLAVGLATFAIYDEGKKSIFLYGLPDGKQIGQRSLSEDVSRLGIIRIFSDGHKGLYLATKLEIYHLL